MSWLNVSSEIKKSTGAAFAQPTKPVALPDTFDGLEACILSKAKTTVLVRSDYLACWIDVSSSSSGTALSAISSATAVSIHSTEQSILPTSVSYPMVLPTIRTLEQSVVTSDGSSVSMPEPASTPPFSSPSSPARDTLTTSTSFVTILMSGLASVTPLTTLILSSSSSSDGTPLLSTTSVEVPTSAPTPSTSSPSIQFQPKVALDVVARWEPWGRDHVSYYFYQQPYGLMPDCQSPWLDAYLSNKKQPYNETVYDYPGRAINVDAALTTMQTCSFDFFLPSGIKCTYATNGENPGRLFCPAGNFDCYVDPSTQTVQDCSNFIPMQPMITCPITTDM